MSFVIRLLYTSLLVVALPFLLLKMAVRNLRDNEGHRKAGPATRVFERFGIIRAKPPQGGVLFHTVSVGETMAAMSLISRFIDLRPHTGVTVTCTTPSGSRLINERLGARVNHFYLPFDLPWSVSTFLRRIRPSAVVILETELWPNLTAACHRHDIPILLVNARLSEKSFRGYAKFQPLVRAMLNQFNVISSQSEDDAQRFLKLGLVPDKSFISGNLKFDIAKSDNLEATAGELNKHLFGRRRKWLAASTHEGEDDIVLSAHKILLNKFPNLVLVLVPRHPQRARSIELLCERKQLRWVKRSDDRVMEDDCQVFILDTLGELMYFYAASEISFVGGSLIEHGGHNPLEPALLAKPILSGPHVHNFAKIYRELEGESGVLIVRSSEEITASVTRLIDDPDFSEQLGRAASAYLARHQGATEKTLALIDKFLPAAKK